MPRACINTLPNVLYLLGQGFRLHKSLWLVSWWRKCLLVASYRMQVWGKVKEFTWHHAHIPQFHYLFVGLKKNLNYSMAKGKQSHKHTNCLRCLSTRHSNDMLGFLETQPPHFYNSQSSIEGYITTVLKIWCLHMKQICNVTISKVAIRHAVFSFNPSLERSLGTARHNCSQKLTPDIMHSRVQ